jgi:hypothetical protein
VGYEATYREFDSPLMRQIRREAYGEDIGQHSWVGAAELRGVDEFGDGFAQLREHAFQSGMEQQRFLVAHQEMIELHVEGRGVNRQAKQVGRNFMNGGHWLADGFHQ